MPQTICTRATRLLTTIIVSCSLGAPLLATSAQAQTALALIDGGTISGVLSTARKFGSAAISRQSNGDPLVVGNINNYRYTLRFLNCAERPACEDVNFRVGFQIKPSLESINAWNASKRFSRAYLDGDGDAILEMDLTLKGGVSATNLAASFTTWRLSLTQFIDHLNTN